MTTSTTAAGEYPAELAGAVAGAFDACRLCGVRPGRRESDELWTEDVHPHRAGPLVWGVDDEGRPRQEYAPQPWRSRHVACRPTAAALIAAVIGVEAPEDVARTAITRSGVKVTARAANAISRRPYSHVDETDRDELRSALRTELDRGRPRRCKLGRCGICGVSRSTGWTRARGVAWSDGSPAPLCADCAAEQRHVLWTDPTAVRVAALARLAGVIPEPSLQPVARMLKLFAEVASDDERHGGEHPAWSYRAEALAAVRAEARRRAPERIADPLQRAIGVKLLAARRIRAAREEAARKDAGTPGAGSW